MIATDDSSQTVADRPAFFLKLEESIVSHKTCQKSFALLLINLKRFRRFNLSQGYLIADQLLQLFAQRLTSMAREQDFIARVGNAEFAMILPEILNEGHASLAAIKFINSLTEAFSLSGEQFYVNAHIGITLFPEHGLDAKELLQNTEKALSDAALNSESYALYSTETRHSDIQVWDIEKDLQRAIEQDQFELYFQPQVNLKTGKLFGAEALIRWKNGDKGFVRPDIFIPVAEDNGYIVPITQWTINAALWLKKEWPQSQNPLKVAVNISTRMLSQPDFVEMVQGALRIHDTSHEELTLEITESALVEDLSTSFKLLNELKSQGINISIDDFGTGYSSMAYFKNIPANEIKIDQSFVRYMLENQMDQHIVQTIINLARGFDLKVVAEGIEDQPTFDGLNLLGCDIAQGYHLAKPMPQQEFINWVKSYNR